MCEHSCTWLALVSWHPFSASTSGKYFLTCSPSAALTVHEPIAEYLGVPSVAVLFMFALTGIVVLAGVCVAGAVALGPSAADRIARKRN